MTKLMDLHKQNQLGDVRAREEALIPPPVWAEYERQGKVHAVRVYEERNISKKC